MFTIERGVRIPLRDIKKGVKKVVRVVSPLWDGDRLAVTFLENVVTAETDYSSMSGRYKFVRQKTLHSVSLYSGQASAYTNGRVGIGQIVEASVDPGDVCFFSIHSYGGRQQSPVELFINKFTANDEDGEVLSACRDAIFMGDLGQAKKLGKEVIPFGWDLFEALMVRERTIQVTKLNEQQV